MPNKCGGGAEVISGPSLAEDRWALTITCSLLQFLFPLRLFPRPVKSHAYLKTLECCSSNNINFVLVQSHCSLGIKMRT